MLIVAEGATVRWLLKDTLGTPRMIADQTGSLSGMRRHDYYPFGEENLAGPTIRTAGNGYQADNVRQKFTGYEHDGETDLDFAEARYCSTKQGRFTSSDPLISSADPFDPQSWNRYIYVGNRPTMVTDPNGLKWYFNGNENHYQWFKDGVDPGAGWVEVSTFHIYDSILGEIVLLPDGKWDYTRNFLPPHHESVLRDNALSPFFLALFAAYLAPFTAAQSSGGTFAGFIRSLFVGELAGEAIDGMIDVTPDIHKPADEPKTEMLKLSELTPTEEVRSKSNLKNLIPQIAKEGIKEPIEYVERNGVKYIVNGHHRYAAAYKLRLGEVPAKRVSLPRGGYKTVEDLTAVSMSRFLKVLKYIR